MTASYEVWLAKKGFEKSCRTAEAYVYIPVYERMFFGKSFEEARSIFTKVLFSCTFIPLLSGLGNA